MTAIGDRVVSGGAEGVVTRVEQHDIWARSIAGTPFVARTEELVYVDWTPRALRLEVTDEARPIPNE